MAEGVDYRDQTEIRGLGQTAGGPWILTGVANDTPFEFSADFLIDGSGAGGFLAGARPIGSALEELELDTALDFGHFTGLASFPELSPGP